MAASGAELAQRIDAGKLALIRRCDAVVANLRPCRGQVEPDSGTVFEVGVAIALGEPLDPMRSRSTPLFESFEQAVAHLARRQCATGRLQTDRLRCRR
jgi:nucleoside 2-deoxyribosyltransferase